VYVLSLSRSPVHVPRGKRVPRGNGQHVPLCGVKWDRTSARTVTLDAERVKEQLNEPRQRFKVDGLDIIAPVIRYGNVQGSTILVDAFQRPLDRKRRFRVLFSDRCSLISKPRVQGHHAGISQLWKDVSSCQRISTSVATKMWRGCRQSLRKTDTNQLTAGHIKHSIPVVHANRLWCEEMRLIFWNGDPYLACRRNRTGLLDPTSKKRFQ